MISIPSNVILKGSEKKDTLAMGQAEALFTVL